MSTTHNELLQLIKTLETYVLNDAQLREVYNKNKNNNKSFRASLKLIGSRSQSYPFISNQEKSALLAKIQKVNSKYKNGTNPNNLTKDDRNLLKKILRHEMYILLKNSPIPNESTNSFLNNFKPKP